MKRLPILLLLVLIGCSKHEVVGTAVAYNAEHRTAIITTPAGDTVTCEMDGEATEGDEIVTSTQQAGICHDTGKKHGQ